MMRKVEKTKRSRISVVIPSSKSKYLSETLESLMNQTTPPLEIIVVDNSQVENESEKIKKLAGKYGVKYVRENREGLHNARNIGVIEAKGEIVQFVDDDTIPDRKLIEEMEKIFSRFSNIGIVAGRVIPDFRTTPPKYMKYLRFSYLSTLDYGNEIKQNIEFINGANISFPKDVYISVGGVNPDSFSSREKIWLRGDGESGFLAKVKETGKKVIYNPHAIVKHIITDDRFKLSMLKRKAFSHGIQMSYSKFFGGKFPARHILLMRGIYFLLIYFVNKLGSKFSPSHKKVGYDVLSYLYLARGIYELKLIYDHRLREHVAKKNWINDLIQSEKSK